MKTSEFIERLDEHKDKVLKVYQEYNLYDEFETTIKTDQFTITYRNNEEPNGLIDIIAEYLNTPVNERKEEKRYYLRLKGFHTGQETYLCSYDFWSDWILVDENHLGYLNHGDEFYFKFNEVDIKNLPEEIKGHNWEYVEATENENK